MSLEEIKREIDSTQYEEVDLLELRLKMKGLEKEVSQLLVQLENKDREKLEDLKKKVSPESFSLIQTLLLLLS